MRHEYLNSCRCRDFLKLGTLALVVLKNVDLQQEKALANAGVFLFRGQCIAWLFYSCAANILSLAAVSDCLSRASCPLVFADRRSSIRKRPSPYSWGSFCFPVAVSNIFKIFYSGVSKHFPRCGLAC